MPIHFVMSDDALTSSGLGAAFALSIPVPAGARAGDSMIVVVAGDSNNAWAIDGGTDWRLDLDTQLANARLLVARRAVRDEDGPAIELPLTDEPDGLWLMGVMLLYREIEDAAAVGASAVNVNAANNFPCPARVLGRYSDLYLGVVVISSFDIAVTPPAGTTERYEAGNGFARLEIFELLREAPGGTGEQVATVAGPLRNGVAASLALPGADAAGGRAFALSPIGAPGLPTRGV